MKITGLLMATAVIAMIGFAGCTLKDEDIKTTIEKKLKAEPDMSGAVVDVKNGIATIEGQCRDNACKDNCEKIAQEVKGVKTVISNLTVVPLAPVPPITSVSAPDSVAAINEPDDALAKSVAIATKKFPTVKASVKDGIVTLSGKIRKDDLPVLMKELTSLKPKKIEKKLTVIKSAKKKNSKSKKRSRRK